MTWEDITALRTDIDALRAYCASGDVSGRSAARTKLRETFSRIRGTYGPTSGSDIRFALCTLHDALCFTEETRLTEAMVLMFATTTELVIAADGVLERVEGSLEEVGFDLVPGDDD